MTDAPCLQTPARSGTIFESAASHDILVRNGLGNVDSIFSIGTDARQRHSGRSVWDTQLIAADGRSVHVYVKMNWGRQRLWPRMTDLKTGQWLQSLPIREWNGLAALGALGLNVPERLAVFHSGIFSFRSAVVVRAVPPAASVQQMLEQGQWGHLATEQQKEILDRIVEAVQTIHAAGLGWRGTSVGHFYPELSAAGDCKMWLIDCEGVHNRATQRTFDRDYRKLARSFEQVGADHSTLSRLQRRIGQLNVPGVRPAA